GRAAGPGPSGQDGGEGGLRLAPAAHRAGAGGRVRAAAVPEVPPAGGRLRGAGLGRRGRGLRLLRPRRRPLRRRSVPLRRRPVRLRLPHRGAGARLRREDAALRVPAGAAPGRGDAPDGAVPGPVPLHPSRLLALHSLGAAADAGGGRVRGDRRSPAGHRRDGRGVQRRRRRLPPPERLGAAEDRRRAAGSRRPPSAGCGSPLAGARSRIAGRLPGLHGGVPGQARAPRMSETPGASTAAPAARAPDERAFLALGSIGLVGFCVGWCSFFHFESMIGDDIALLDYFQQKGSILQLSVLSTISDKYRPVYFVLQHVVVRLFGGHYPLYFWLNVVIHAGLTLAVFGIAFHLTRGARWVSLAVALLFASARFAFYEITQVVGL